MTASEIISAPRSVAEQRLLYFGTGRWRHDFLTGERPLVAGGGCSGRRNRRHFADVQDLVSDRPVWSAHLRGPAAACRPSAVAYGWPLSDSPASRQRSCRRRQLSGSQHTLDCSPVSRREHQRARRRCSIPAPSSDALQRVLWDQSATRNSRAINSATVCRRRISRARPASTSTSGISGRLL